MLVGSDAEELGDAADESYALHIGTDGTATAHAPGVFAALRALESFAQLIERGDPPGSTAAAAAAAATTAATAAATAAPLLQLRGLPWNITDTPRFRHRGYLLDTAHYFYSVEKLERILLLASFFKYNVFHWHITDHQVRTLKF